ncbi:Ciliary outer arm dynein beta heavy chain [Fasciola gigantica]|uniref:Ciliary outer arm dynein beta heavy chain n=1 Tax=Fasciola gigantica TaxID=46835 RepID=A0A504YGN6_FASGI|nr:Ciliary outer arm dynein beta heavy chain [Fasciola gigantica]
MQSTNTEGSATPPRLFITSGSHEGLRGMCYIFLRMTDKAITGANIASEVVFQQLDASGGNLVQSLVNYFEKLVIPLLENNEDWGTLGKIGQSADVDEFFIEVRRYMDALNSARENMDDKIDLSTEEENSLVVQLSNPNELPNIGTSFEILIDEMRTPSVQAVIMALQYARARIIKYWRQLVSIY